MIRKLTFAFAIIATSFTLAFEAEAGPGSFGKPGGISTMDLGSGR